MTQTKFSLLGASIIWLKIWCCSLEMRIKRYAVDIINDCFSSNCFVGYSTQLKLPKTFQTQNIHDSQSDSLFLVGNILLWKRSEEQLNK